MKVLTKLLSSGQRFSDEGKKFVDACYLRSKFLGNSSANDFVNLFEHYEIGLFIC